MRFLSTPSARRATPPDLLDADALVISIHALREEGDPPVPEAGRPGADISIHALREEGDSLSRTGCSGSTGFLSTPSARRATMMPIRNRRRRGFLSTPSARRATGTVDDADFLKVFLSTPSARRATKPAVVDVLSQRFLSTPSARRATRFLPVPCWAKAYFYPRPPRGGRPNSRSFLSSRRRFLSTPSARRATRRSATSSRSLTHFSPRPPRGGRPPLCSGLECLYQFLSTPSARRATDAGGRRPGRGDISIHALREEGDRWTRCLPRPA